MSRCCLRLDERGQAALAEARRQVGRVGKRGQAARRPALDPHVDGGEVVAQQLAEVVAQPGHDAELERVHQLVDRDPAQEALAVGPELGGRGGPGWAPRTAAAAGSRRGPAATARTGPARAATCSRVTRPTSAARVTPAPARSAPANGPGVASRRRSSRSATGSSSGGQRGQVGLGPLRAADHLGRGQRRRRAPARALAPPRARARAPSRPCRAPRSGTSSDRAAKRAICRARPQSTIRRKARGRAAPARCSSTGGERVARIRQPLQHRRRIERQRVRLARPRPRPR